MVFLTRRRTWLSLLGLMTLVPVIAVHGAPNEIVIKLGTVAPEGSAWHDALLQLRQDWRDISNGQVELRIYAGGVLGGEDEMVRKVQRRGLDAIAISGGGLSLIDDSVNCLNLPLLFDSYEELDYIRTRISPQLEPRLAKQNFKILNWAEAGWIYFFTTDPVQTPDDVRSLRLWISAGDPKLERLYKQFGFKVVPLSTIDMLTSLQTGLIEAIDVPPLYALLDRSYQVANYMLDLRWAPLNAATVISIDAWQRIPEDFRPEMLAASQRAGATLRTVVRKAGEDALEEMQLRGLHVIDLDPETRAVWQHEAEKAWVSLRGDYVEADLFDAVMQFRTEYKNGQTRGSPDDQ
jgi:TRAP-type C4-dicarboxylate transport system substrate-binding protein